MVSVMDDCNINFVASVKQPIRMNSKFSPKFTIVTSYPMMFAAADLKCLESELASMLMQDGSAYSDSLSMSSEHGLYDVLAYTDGLAAPRWKQESKWLQQTKQYLEYLWHIDVLLDQDPTSIWPSAVDPILPKD